MFQNITVQTLAETGSLSILIFTILLAFVLSTLLAYVYQKTFRGLSYSRNYVQSIVLISIISTVIIQSVGDSLSRGIGIMAAMSIIRFRTNFKDPRDTLFLFASLAAGISCGAYAFPIAIIGTVGFCLGALLLYFSPLGPHSLYDGMLRFNTGIEHDQQTELQKLLQDYCKVFALVTLRELAQGNRLDFAYHIKLRRGKTHDQLIRQLKTIDDVQGVSVMMQESTVDI